MRWFSLPLALLALKAFVNAEQLTNSKRVDGQISNAERLARGLPLLPPHRRTGPLLPRQSTSPPVPTSRSCNIEAINDVDQSIYGYLSIAYGEGSPYTYGDFTDSPALNISLAYSSDPSGYQTSFTGLQAQTENSQVQKYYGYLGVVPVETPITASSGYGVLTDVTKYANSPSSNSPSSFAQFLGFGQPAESYVWSLDLTTNELGLSWTTTDGSSLPLQLGMDEQGQMLYLSANLAATEAELAGEDYVTTLVPLRFRCYEI